MSETYTATRAGESPGIRFTASDDTAAKRRASRLLESGCHAGQKITLVRRGEGDEPFTVWTKAGRRRWEEKA